MEISASLSSCAFKIISEMWVCISVQMDTPSQLYLDWTVDTSLIPYMEIGAGLSGCEVKLMEKRSVLNACVFKISNIGVSLSTYANKSSSEWPCRK